MATRLFIKGHFILKLFETKKESYLGLHHGFEVGLEIGELHYVTNGGVFDSPYLLSYFRRFYSSKNSSVSTHLGKL